MANKEEKKKDIRFFCGLETLQVIILLQRAEDIDLKTAGNAEFELDIIEQPYRLAYTADRRNITVNVYKRTELGVNYKGGPDAIIDVTRSNGNVQFKSGKEISQDNLTLYLFVCFNLTKYVTDNGLLRKCEDNTGILLESKAGRITSKTVSGKDRPKLMVTKLFGTPDYGRPYEDEIMAHWAIEVMSLEQMEELAEAGDINVMDELHLSYLRGDEKTGQDFVKAAYWVKKMADAGSSDGMFNLALHYCKGCGVERDLEQAIFWMEKAKEAGDEDAENLIPKYIKARDNLRKAEAGDAQAMADYARFLLGISGSLEEMGPEKDYAEFFEWAKKSAAQFNLDGICALGMCYEHGHGVEEDCAKAFKLYERAALKGHALSMTSLGCLYGKGAGVEKDERKAMEWIRKAAVLHDPLALRLLGKEQKEAKDILEGMDIEKLMEDVKAGNKEAIKHYAVACMQGSKYIDDTFEHGEQMLNELAEKGDTESLRILGFTYRQKSSDGEKLYEDMMLKAIVYYERIGDELYTNAEMARETASCYSWMPDQKNSLDADLAIFWYKIAADLGNDEAKRLYSLCTYTRDKKAALGIRDDGDVVLYLAEKGLFPNEYSPEYKPAKVEHDRLYDNFCIKYGIDRL